MTDADIEAEVKRLSEYLKANGHWVIDLAPYCRTNARGMAHLLGIGLEGMRWRVKHGVPPEPKKIRHRNTFYIRDYVVLSDFEKAA